VPIKNPPEAHRVTGTTDPITTRHMRNAWFMPFCRTLDIEYPSGLRHIIFNSATPIDDGSIQLVQILFRSDREEDCSTRELIDWDAAIISEDREILESTDPDAIVDLERKIEMHMPSDRPGLIMRKRLLGCSPSTARRRFHASSTRHREASPASLTETPGRRSPAGSSRWQMPSLSRPADRQPRRYLPGILSSMPLT
jgi:hypothetical protein